MRASREEMEEFQNLGQTEHHVDQAEEGVGDKVDE